MVVKNNYFWLPETSKIGFIANGEIGEVRSIRNIHERYGFTFCEATVAFVDYPEEDAIDVILNLSTLSSEGPALTSAQVNTLYEQLVAKYSYLSSKRKIYEAIKNDPNFFYHFQSLESATITVRSTRAASGESVDQLSFQLRLPIGDPDAQSGGGKGKKKKKKGKKKK